AQRSRARTAAGRPVPPQLQRDRDLRARPGVLPPGVQLAFALPADQQRRDAGDAPAGVERRLRPARWLVLLQPHGQHPAGPAGQQHHQQHHQVADGPARLSPRRLRGRDALQPRLVRERPSLLGGAARQLVRRSWGPSRGDPARWIVCGLWPVATARRWLWCRLDLPLHGLMGRSGGRPLGMRLLPDTGSAPGQVPSRRSTSQAMERTPYENPTAEVIHAPRVPSGVVWLAAMLGLAVALIGVLGLLKILLVMYWLVMDPAIHLEAPGAAVIELVFFGTAIT